MIFLSFLILSFISGVLASQVIQRSITEYFISSEKNNFTDAEATCRQNGYAGLASLSPLTEMMFLQDAFSQYRDKDYWVGAWLPTRCTEAPPRECRNQWLWRDGTPMSNEIIDNGWRGDEPGYFGDLCARLTNDGLAGRRCNATYTFICEKVDFCLSSPCRNNATCASDNETFTCTCLEGYSGTGCETEVDECESDPCVNGYCIDGINEFTCNCTAGEYNGIVCPAEPSDEDEDITKKRLTIALISGAILDAILLPTAILLYMKYRTFKNKDVLQTASS